MDASGDIPTTSAITNTATTTVSFDEGDIAPTTTDDDDDDDSLLGGLDLEDLDDILKEDEAADPSSTSASATITTTSTTPADATAPTDLPPGIPIPERKKTKQQHLKQCINGGTSRYKKKYKASNPTVYRKLDQSFMDSSYRQFFGLHQGICTFSSHSSHLVDGSVPREVLGGARGPTGSLMNRSKSLMLLVLSGL